jgi:3-hydroxyacyl-CoA dehydrogenase/enoyl-CoA hydratase/3-hydroxybutyryl-CoA epimerase
MELMDMVGLDICNKVGEELSLAPEGEGSQDNVLASLVKQGKLGKKTGRGFYQWEDGKPKREPMDFSDTELTRLGEKLMAPLLAEAARAEAEGVVADADHVDAGVIFGTGFAPFRGGPLHYAKTKDAAPNKEAA